MNAETVKAAIAAGIANAPAAPKAPKAKKAPAKKATPKVEAPQVDVQQALVAGLREAGVKATLALSPAGHGRVLVDGYNVAYADKQTRNGCKVTPALSTDDVPAAKRGSFKAAGRAGANYGLVALVTEANLAETVALLVQAAAKRAAAVAAKPAKPAAKKPAAKKAPARKAAAKKAPATEAAATTEA